MMGYFMVHYKVYVCNRVVSVEWFKFRGLKCSKSEIVPAVPVNCNLLFMFTAKVKYKIIFQISV